MTDFFDARLAALAGTLTQEEPIGRVPRETAAVAVALADDASGGSVLLIRRAEREGDPWSGDVALPGGRVERGDASFRDAAVREAREEVGLDLAPGARFLGYMRGFQARRRGIWVVPAVFATGTGPKVRVGDEVASFLWVSLTDLMARESRSSFTASVGGEERAFPSFSVGGQVVWGLTERILSSLVEPLGATRPTSRRSP